MKRFHVNLGVSDIAQSISFYTTLFGEPPIVEKQDYAKWMLNDPHVNFSISTRSNKSGIDHVGIQAENDVEFSDLRDRLNKADTPSLEQQNVTCCYAKSSKTWVYDPDGIAWETFLTHGNSTIFSDMDNDSSLRIANVKDNNASCCVPSSSCCENT